MEVTLKLDQYDISITDGLENLDRVITINKYSGKVILVDENTRAYCLPLLIDRVPSLQNALILEIPEGEEYKNINTCTKLWRALLNGQIGRNSLWVNLGGGVISDMGGFVASTFKRGVDFINIPTTLLAQVDATIGGKLGIDFKGVKNIIGLFNNPKAVLIYPAFINTLAREQVLSGFGEIIKHSLIGSIEMWKEIIQKDPFKITDWSKLIYRSLQIKKDIVERDFYEQGPRKALNFGHTIGHALESFSMTGGKKRLFHGHAVAWGMLAEAYLSYKLANLSAEELKSIEEFILANYRDTLDKSLLTDKLISFMLHDKKNEGENFNFSLLKSIGEVRINVECTEGEVKDGIAYLKSIVCEV